MTASCLLLSRMRWLLAVASFGGLAAVALFTHNLPASRQVAFVRSRLAASAPQEGERSLSAAAAAERLQGCWRLSDDRAAAAAAENAASIGAVVCSAAAADGRLSAHPAAVVARGRDDAAPDYSFVSCFVAPPKESGARVVAAGGSGGGSALTVEGCLHACYDNGHAYAALIGDSVCLCREQRWITRLLPDARCDQPCAGDRSALCGGQGSAAVYHLRTADGERDWTTWMAAPGGGDAANGGAPAVRFRGCLSINSRRNRRCAAEMERRPGGGGGSVASRARQDAAAARRLLQLRDFVGCFAVATALRHVAVAPNATAVSDSCLATCASRGFSYAFLRVGTGCACSSTLGVSRPVAFCDGVHGLPFYLTGGPFSSGEGDGEGDGEGVGVGGGNVGQNGNEHSEGHIEKSRSNVDGVNENDEDGDDLDNGDDAEDENEDDGAEGDASRDDMGSNDYGDVGQIDDEVDGGGDADDEYVDDDDEVADDDVVDDDDDANEDVGGGNSDEMRDAGEIRGGGGGGSESSYERGGRRRLLGFGSSSAKGAANDEGELSSHEEIIREGGGTVDSGGGDVSGGGSVELHFDDLPSERRRALLLAYHRSGSTYASEIISKHPGALYIFEPDVIYSNHHRAGAGSYGGDEARRHVEFFRAFERYLLCDVHRLPLAWMTLNSFFPRPFEHSPRMAAYIRCLRRHRAAACAPLFQAHCEAASIVSAKTIRITATPQTAEFVRAHPSLVLLHLMRDPRAVVSSRKFFEPVTRAGACALCRDMQRTAQYVNQTAAAATAAGGGSSVFNLYYESLVVEPVFSARRIYSDMLRLNITEAIVERLRVVSGQQDDGGPAVRLPQRYSTRKEHPAMSLRKWKWQLTGQEVSTVRACCGASVLRWYPQLSAAPLKVASPPPSPK